MKRESREDRGSVRFAVIEAQHKLLQKRIASVLSLVEEEFFSWDQVRTALVEMREALESHFTMEESGGYLSEILAQAPERNLAVGKLESDHSRMRGGLAQILAEALVARSREDLRKSVKAFIATLSAHERDEHDLVQAVFSTDVAATD